MVPRPMLNGQLAHRHVLTCSNTTDDPIYITQEPTAVSQFVSTARTGANLSLTFSLSEVVLRIQGLTAITLNPPGNAELINLYDTFQIEKVELSLWSSATQSPTFATATLPLIGHTVDNDDANNTSITSLQQYSTYKCDQLGNAKPIKVTFVPTPIGNVVTGQTRLQRQDINTAYPSTVHYGYKMCCDGFHIPVGSTFATTYLSFQFRIHYLMKATR